MIGTILGKIFGTKSERDVKKILPVVPEVNNLEDDFSKLTDGQLLSKTEEFRTRLNSGETLDDILVEAFAVVREASKRTIGLRHFDVQLIGGVVLHQGKIAEMKTGEGKTLVATLAAYLNGLTGKGVHVVTVNDYLAKRDSEWMGPIYKYLGLSVGLIQHDMPTEERRADYNSDITYVTNNELGFDYLRDNMVLRKEERVLRELNFAIVDEVDSQLIDEAKTPLIISGPAEEATDKYYIINRLVPSLKGRFITEAEEIDAKYKEIDLSKGYDYIVDEKAHSAVLTEQGVSKCEKMLGIKNMYEDIQSEWTHHITQALRSHNLFKRDRDYVVKDGEVVIVDEFTGRLMPGRRWSEGLHQAIEAKENLRIAEENQTLATITFQNFFRLYKKLAGMTGTALTEANELWEIYKLDVVEIPTNKPMIRDDYPDVIYKTEKEKYEAIVKEIEELYRQGRPVLVGTRSIEKNEKLSAMLKRKGVPHQVLNAKYHEMEATIIAQAGKLKAVTIATNMAGRGTDIILGGNPQDEEESKKIVEMGGFHVLGTERHEARRIDNQLRGRCGRQGDPGSSSFYLALDDELMRLFGSDRISPIMEKLGMEEGQDIQHPMISRAIEGAQRKVEGMNFEIRKNLLEYDNVMNKQRLVIYNLRNDILEGENVFKNIEQMIEESVDERIELYTPKKVYPEKWDIENISVWLNRAFGLNLVIDKEKLLGFSQESFKEFLLENIKKVYTEREENFGTDIMREMERRVLLQVIDICWKDHLYDLDQLRRGIGLRAYGQKDPLIEYQHESFNQFMNMMRRIREETIQYIFRIQFFREPVRHRPSISQKEEKIPTGASAVSKPSKIGRNDPCLCGSGKKYKKCCGR